MLHGKCQLAIRYILRVWAGEVEIPPTQPTEEDEKALIRLAQSVPMTADGYRPSVAGPVVSESGILCYRQLKSDGEWFLQPIVSYAARQLQRRIIADAHRSLLHPGHVTVCHSLRFHLESGMRSFRDFGRSCVGCALRRTKLEWNSPFTAGSELLKRLPEWTVPFQRTAIDFVFFGDKQTALSVMCLFSGYVQLIMTTATDSVS